MALPYRVSQNGVWHWAGRILPWVLIALWYLVRVRTWSNSGFGLLADAMIIAIAVMGQNLITGYTGQLSIGGAAFFAIGAYTALMLTEGRIWTPFLDDNMWTAGWTLPVAAVVCFVIGVVVGLPALRLKGIYLALTTLVLVEAVLGLLRWDKVAGTTGGANGIKGSKYIPPEWTPFDGRRDLNVWMMWLSVAILALFVLLVSGLLRSRIGRAMVATRDNETASTVMGVNVSFVKTVVFGLSGAITGVAGALFGLKLGLVDPAVPLFGLVGAITILVAMVIGGAAQLWGPLAGGLFYVAVNEWARSVGEDPQGSLLFSWVGDDTKLNGLAGVIFGALLVLVARFAPFGVVGTFKIMRSRVVQVVPTPPDIGAVGRIAPAGTADANLETESNHTTQASSHTTEGDT